MAIRRKAQRFDLAWPRMISLSSDSSQSSGILKAMFAMFAMAAKTNFAPVLLIHRRHGEPINSTT